MRENKLSFSLQMLGIPSTKSIGKKIAEYNCELFVRWTFLQLDWLSSKWKEYYERFSQSIGIANESFYLVVRSKMMKVEKIHREENMQRSFRCGEYEFFFIFFQDWILHKRKTLIRRIKLKVMRDKQELRVIYQQVRTMKIRIGVERTSFTKWKVNWTNTDWSFSSSSCWPRKSIIELRHVNEIFNERRITPRKFDSCSHEYLIKAVGEKISLDQSLFIWFPPRLHLIFYLFKLTWLDKYLSLDDQHYYWKAYSIHISAMPCHSFISHFNLIKSIESSLIIVFPLQYS